MSVFDVNNRVDHTSVSSFLDPTGGPTIQRYDTLKYKQFDQLTDKQLEVCNNSLQIFQLIS